VLPKDSIPAPPDPTVYSALGDSRGRIYVCTNNGVQQLSPRADGGYESQVFRRRDGLVHDECNTGSQLVDGHDRYWAGTLGGLSVFDPAIRTEIGATEPKPLFFTRLRVDGEARDAEPDRMLDLAAGTRDIRIDFALLAGMRETESTYRSQLIGFDPQPGAWTFEHSRHFNSLPPGRYRLGVEARDYAGTSSATRTFAFSIAPYWWQRGGVQLAAAIAALLVAAGLVMLYNRSLRKRERDLVREVAVRTAELRAANQRLTELSYVDPLTGVANRRRLMEAIDAAIKRAVAQRLPIGLIVIDVDHFKAYNDRFGHLAGDAALRAVAHALDSATREQDLIARFGGEEFACLMVDADIDTVARIAERMRALVEALPPRVLGNDSDTITISAGILSRAPREREHAADLLNDADAALYQAKRDGRNRIGRVALD
jgi:diguanylate cyclase (GGDEF)-like protein